MKKVKHIYYHSMKDSYGKMKDLKDIEVTFYLFGFIPVFKHIELSIVLEDKDIDYEKYTNSNS